MATKKQNTEIVSLFEEKAGAGIGEVSADDLATPRIVMIQPGSPQIKKSSTKYLADASVGDLLFTATNTIVDGEEGIRFLPVYFDRNYIEWNLRENGGGFVAAHPKDTPLLGETQRDAQFRDIRTYSDGRQTELQNTANHYGYAIIEGSPQRCVINMTRSQLKKSRGWLGMINGTRLNGKNGEYTPPAHSHFYLIQTEEVSATGKSSYYNYHITQERILGNEEVDLFREADDFSKFCEGGGMQAMLSSSEATEAKTALENQSSKDWE
tara:strand:+ start:439 stop:1239 length:801 start_codon:yes stop_codon:yes gene_type:complete